MKLQWDTCLRDEIPVPPAVAEWMNSEHDRTLKILTEREMELAKAAEDKKLLAAKIDKLVGDLNTERAARDDGREGFSALSRPAGLLRAPVKPVQLGQQTTRSLSCVDFWNFWKRETPWSQTRDSQFSSPE